MLFLSLWCVTNLQRIKWGGLGLTPTPTSALFAGSQCTTRGNQLLFRMEVHLISFLVIFKYYSPITAFHPWTNDEHRQLGDEYLHLSTPTACKNFMKEHATRYCQLSCLPYFNLVKQIIIDPMHYLFLGMFINSLFLFYADPM
jgi:hypothetical protein